MRRTIAILTVLVLGCMDTDMSDPEAAARAEVDAKAAPAIALANSGSCVSKGSCRMIGFGTKPCGGPWGYLIYSNTIDTVQLATLVQEYNDAEARYNRDWSVTSDCSIARRPDSLACVNGKCLGYFNGVPTPN